MPSADSFRRGIARSQSLIKWVQSCARTMWHPFIDNPSIRDRLYSSASLEKLIGEIRSVRVQGAKQIAIHCLKFLRELAQERGFGKEFDIAADKLKQIRPTAVVLHNCVEEVRQYRTVATIDDLISYLDRSSEQIARYSDKVLRSNACIMTHCHSGEAMAFLKDGHTNHKKAISVIATITQPLEQGITTSKELTQSKIPVTLILDSAVGLFMKDVDAVVVGADSLRLEGVVNKIGTSLLAFASKHYNKPFYVIANIMKIDKRKKFIIEERPASEVYKEIMTTKNLHGIKIRNPAFDITPWKYVTEVITDKGVMKPAQLIRRLK